MTAKEHFVRTEELILKGINTSHAFIALPFIGINEMSPTNP
jgi:hypothetical protein